MKKRFLAIILTISVLIGNLPLFSATVFAVSNNQQQIEYTGGWNNENPMPQGNNSKPYETTGTLYKDRIAVSKTVEATDKENYFDINLKVVAKEQVIDQSVDVVLVLDISNTMNATHEGLTQGSYGYDVKDARITHGKKAVSQFIDAFATDKNISQNRRLGVVTFNTYANNVQPLTTMNTTAQATALKSTINSVTAPSGRDEKFTNIEGGLQMAYNMLKTSDAVYKYVVFVTDGFPTTYIKSDRDSTSKIIGYSPFTTGTYNASKINTDGYFADSVTRKLCGWGVNYSDKAADRADDVAATMKNNGINIFSIGIDVGVQQIGDFLKAATSRQYTTVDRRSTNHIIGNTKDSYQRWLSHSIAGGPLIDDSASSESLHRYAEGNSQNQLNTAFANILSDMELIPAETMKEAYTIDPMSDYVDFMHFYNLNGNAVNKITHTESGSDIAIFDNVKKEIKWWLTDTQNLTVDNHGNYVLNIKYRVRLKNEVDGFNPSTAFPTNDTTTLYFKTVDASSGEPLYGDNDIDYRIPEVEGYLGDLTFTKIDAETNAPLKDAKFTLQHYGDSCDICNGDAHIDDMTAISDDNGIVNFNDIPSGHEYALIETQAPDGYQSGAVHAVKVEYSKVFLHNKELTATNPGIVTNTKITPVTLNLTAKKTLNNGNLQAGQFTFILSGQGQGGTNFHERHTNDANGNVTFLPITFDRVGNYEFTVYEQKGSDSAVVYDTASYKVNVSVTVNSAGTAYELTTKINGADVENDNAPDAFDFTNKVRENGTVQFRATKYLDGNAPADGQFEFVLEDQQGNLLQSKKNVGSNVIFDSISYSQAGVYTYTIYEIHSEDERIFCDHSVYKAIVTVTAPQTDGAFETKVDYMLNGTNTPVNEVVFNNKTRAPAKLHIMATKTMDGQIPQDGQFTFELRDENGAIIQTVANDEYGVITFDTLTFDRVNLETFTVYEVKENNENIIYDKIEYKITVETEFFHNNDHFLIDITVEKPLGNGFTEIQHIFDAYEADLAVGAGLDFANKTREPATVQLGGNKTYNNDIPTNGEFSFELYDENGAIIETVTNDADGKYAFTPLQYTASGTYTYTVKEKKDSDTSIIYDSKVYNVVVEVTAPDDSDSYVAEVIVDETPQASTQIDNLNFANRDRETVSVNLVAEKIMDNATPDDGEVFTFLLKDENGVEIQRKNNAGADITFDTLTFDKEGVYTYTIVEVNDGNENIIYDESVYTATVTVTAPQTDGAFEAVVEYTKENNAVNEITFNNKTRIPITVKLGGNKTYNNEIPEDGKFSFELCDESGAIIEAVTNDAEGKYTFTELTYNASGTYTYTVKEQKGIDTSIVYDSKIYNVVVKVTAPDNVDTYVAEVTVDEVIKETTQIDNLDFVNKDREAVSVNLVAEKTMDNETPEEEFTFQLKDENGNVIQSKTNVGKDIIFDDLTFNKEGVYTYTITELNDGEDDIIYDDSVYTVAITVTAPETDGAFEAVVEYTKDNDKVDEIVFNNKTVPEDEDNNKNNDNKNNDNSKGNIEKDKDENANKIPQTGDNSNLMLWIVLLFVSGGIFVKIMLPKKKKNR